MPLMPITTQQLTLPSGVAIVGAVMLFPDDPKAQADYRSAAAKQWTLAKATRYALPLDAAGARWLATHPTAQDGETMLREPYRRGIVAGETLLRALEGAKMADAKAGAVDELKAVYEGSAKNFHNLEWKPFKPVAHLWAVHIERAQNGLGLDYFPAPPAALAGFLAAAEALLILALEPRRQSRYGTLLGAATAWRVAPDLALR